jgi:hypothetical protein
MTAVQWLLEVFDIAAMLMWLLWRDCGKVVFGNIKTDVLHRNALALSKQLYY